MSEAMVAVRRRWLGRAAQGAFWFFLAKGLLWLSLPLAAWLGWSGT